MLTLEPDLVPGMHSSFDGHHHCGSGRRGTPSPSSLNLLRNVDPQIDLHTRAGNRQPRHSDAESGNGACAIASSQTSIGSRQIGEIGMKLLDAHGVAERGAGGAADLLCLADDGAQLGLDRDAVERLALVDAWPRRSGGRPQPPSTPKETIDRRLFIAETYPSNAGASGPRMTSRLVLPLSASEIVLISMRRSLMPKPGWAVAMIVVAGGFLKCDSQTSLKPGTSSRSLR